MNFIHEPERIYALDTSGKLIAEITFPIQDNVATIDHTFVDPSLRGQGVAAKLMKAALTQLKQQHIQVEATCSYAIAYLTRHPQA